MGNVIKSQIVARDTKNILNYTTWIAGDSQATGFNRNGLASENILVNGLDPWGNETVLWLAFPGGSGNDDGGWNTSTFSVDRTKLYRFSVWVKRTVYVDGRFYLGLNGYGPTNGVLNRYDGANNTNPYFWVTSDPPTTAQLPDSTWVLVVGHVWPEGSGTGSFNSNSGLYTIASGKYGNVSSDFVWNTSTTAVHRSYLYYSESNLPRQYWCYPRVDIVDGTEPTIAQLLGGYGALTNSALEKSNFLLGPSDTTSYFSTADGGYYNAIIPPSGGYTIYAGAPATAGSVANAPAMFTSLDDTTLVTDAQNIFKTSFNSTGDVLSWAAARNNVLIVNREYEPIVTSGLVMNLDAGFTPSYPRQGTTWHDVSGNDYNGALTNGPTFNSANGGSIVFDGVDDYANYGNILNNPIGLTVNFWVKNPNNNVIITKGYRLWEIRFAGNEFGGYVGVNNGTSFWYGIADSNNILHGANLAEWNNFAYVYNYTTGNIKFYTNSVEKGNITVSQMFSSYSPTYNLTIGRRVETSDAYFSGNLSTVQIYNRTLSAQEILQNYNATKSRFGL